MIDFHHNKEKEGVQGTPPPPSILGKPDVSLNMVKGTLQQKKMSKQVLILFLPSFQFYSNNNMPLHTKEFSLFHTNSDFLIPSSLEPKIIVWNIKGLHLQVAKKED